VKPETGAYLAKAREDLDESVKIAAIGLARAAARSAYYAVFHAAEALILEQTGRIAKTHSGVRTEFARLIRETGRDARMLTVFLAEAYKYKELGDYGVGPDAEVRLEEAHDLIDRARDFLARVSAILDPSDRG
jgi:uncharacterized protein (UPF0332 family)